MAESLPAVRGLKPAGARTFAWNPGLVIGLGLLGVIALTALIAPIALEGQATGLGGSPSLGSTAEHPLGTDTLGRDMLARTLVATRSTVLMALAATVLSAIVGIAVGIGVWLAPRRVRELGLRAIELAVSYPTMLVAIIVAAILGQGVVQVVVAIAVANIAGFARLTANLASKIAASEYVTTARLTGVPTHLVALRHVLPNMAEPTLILVAGAFSGALVEISGLSFIGLGAQTPAFDWGTLLNDGLSRISVNPVVILGPALALTVASFAALLVGDGLAAAANPRSNTTRARMTRATGSSTAAPAPADAVLVADGITVRHGATGRELVSDLSFTIRRGEVLGIVGESGSGKSLTASVVAKLLGEGLEASARRLELGGTDLLGPVPDRVLAAKIGLIYQDPGTALNPAMVLGTQLSDVLRIRLRHSRRDALDLLLRGFRSVMLSDPEGRLRQYPHQLSGGMKQRAMIASAMSAKPDLLIADEPTTALDVTVQREVLSVLKRMNEDSGTAVLFISHDLGVVRALCDRVLVMKDGRIVERIEDIAHLSEETVTHPYTRQLLAATPVVTVPTPPEVRS
ncbi:MULTISPECIES: dipeptide/oligopeptide/nickel ABC transporter permease/ATP-binding protein [unclassified Rathayibacter]|uniref:dipeptide/oligopeptide/nickel ABC transporter permease/ATP-binding protein n=1 Tax=unclassified Rathayibacter TaxID=2609250 RepID=UPI0010D23698|nr:MULTISPECIES: dipeptide/oligopeptide/nickel ABC transporter permease/ATP-binding protein [unclassified Rathayibacter]MCJ1703319.1 dipeptide/oligopeptide/nickel ABC transporter permease/ATP-binding protein [Rathayibacter sp. VKM Ac-2926]TCL85974.1 ABC-type dipeptide/oligopeptide/nickel transport system ATPase component [Rathayibacter sp. PhB192]TCM31795.1 ABC-type dipeptide/oligopeptide/nickel transport system ATPase component [Rathayibacter sp. PhB179]